MSLRNILIRNRATTKGSFARLKNVILITLHENDPHAFSQHINKIGSKLEFSIFIYCCMVLVMRWNVEDKFASPSTGTFFSLIAKNENSKMILWYSGSRLLDETDCVYSNANDAFVVSQMNNFKILHVFPFSETLWNNMKRHSSCPMNLDSTLVCCTKVDGCIFKPCPYGLPQRDDKTDLSDQS